MDKKRSLVLAGSSIGTLTRIAEVRSDLATTLRSAPLRRSVEQVVKPKSVSSGIRKVGAVLIASPDPITDIPAMALLASSVVLKKREPASLAHLTAETRRVVRDIQLLRL